MHRGKEPPEPAGRRLRGTIPEARGQSRLGRRAIHLSLSRLNHWLPRGQAHPEVVEGTAECHHQITDPLLPQADPVLHDATTLDAAVDMLDPEPPLVERL